MRPLQNPCGVRLRRCVSNSEIHVDPGYKRLSEHLASSRLPRELLHRFHNIEESLGHDCAWNAYPYRCRYCTMVSQPAAARRAVLGITG